MKRIGIADTTFARINMGAIAIDELKKMGTGFKVESTQFRASRIFQWRARSSSARGSAIS